MNIVDIIVVVIILVFIIRGYLKGFVNEVFSLLIIAGSLVASFLLYRPLSNITSNFLNSKELSIFLSFIAVFVLTAIFLILVRNLFISLLENLNLTDIDSLLGLVIGFIKGGLILTFVLMFFAFRNILKTADLIRSSYFFPYFEKSYSFLLLVLPERISVLINRFIGLG